MAEATSSQTLPILAATGSAATGGANSSSGSLTIFAADGIAVSGLRGISEATLGLLTGEGFIEPIQTLPMIEGDGLAVTGEVATSARSLPFIDGTAQASMSAIGASAQEIPAPTGEAFAITQRLGGSAQALPIVDGDGSAITGRMAASSASVPRIDGQAQALTENPGAVVSEQALTLLAATGAAITARIATSNASLPLIVAEAIAFAQARAASGQTLPVWEADGNALANRAGVSTLTLPLIEAGASASTAQQAASVVELPLVQATLGQAQAGGALASSILVLPVWIATGEATGDVVPVGVSKTYAVHAETFAQSRDVGPVFNSVARLGALLIGANENGLYLLGAYDDAGTPIQALAKFPTEDEAGGALRRVESMVVGYRADGELRLTVETDSLDPQEYVMESVGGLGCHPNRVKIGKGMKGAYWRMTLENVDGANFAMDRIDIDWNNLSRRTK